jgi:hypothetical protein
MTTSVKEVPGFKEVARGHDIQVNGGPPTQYLVSHITPYPNDDLIVGNTYNISVPTHAPGIVVKLVHAPGAGMRTATFEQQT